MLPDMDGPQVIRALRAQEATRSIPVVMLTARVDRADEEAAWMLGVFDYVTKPFTRGRLLEVVGAAVLPTWREDQERRRIAALQRLRAPVVAGWQQLAAIVEGSGDAIIGKTLDGTITSWNPAAERLYGYAADEMLGRPISLLVPPGRTDEVPDILRRVGQGERIEEFETVRQRCDGHLIDVSLSISPIRDESGQVRGASTIVRDITARRQAEVRFETFVETAPDAIVIVDEGGVIELVNRRAEILFGYDRTELVGQMVEILVPLWFRVEHPRRRAAYLADPSARPMAIDRDVYGLRKNGSEFPLEISLSPVRTAAGITVSAIVRDITEAKQTEALLRGLLESAPDGMVIIDAAGSIRVVNAQTERLFGYAREDLIGQPVEVLIPQRFRTGHVQRRTDYTARPRVRSMGMDSDLYGLRQDGSEFPVEITLSPIETSEGIVVFGAVRDVTDRKAVENARAVVLQREREVSRRMREVDRLRTGFLATVSHELRTPLTVILGVTEILTGDWTRLPDPQKVDLVERVRRAAKRLDSLMVDVLDFTRLGCGDLSLTVEPQSVGPMIEAATERAGHLLAGHPVAVEVDDGLDVMADPTAFARILDNLLSNAAKFSPPGSKISLSAHPDNHGVAISVADCGPGIPAADIGKIFDRFYRVGGPSNRLPGTGIGLAIVKELTEAQDGHVEVSSAEGAGSTFTIHLPGTRPSA
jgi:protein-histidine pros-kinase